MIHAERCPFLVDDDTAQDELSRILHVPEGQRIQNDRVGLLVIGIMRAWHESEHLVHYPAGWRGSEDIERSLRKFKLTATPEAVARLRGLYPRSFEPGPVSHICYVKCTCVHWLRG